MNFLKSVACQVLRLYTYMHPEVQKTKLQYLQAKACLNFICSPLFTIFYSLLVFSLQHETLSAQNLVPNPSFEDLSECPFYPGRIDYAREWDSPNNTTTDLYHACAPDSSKVNVPRNYLGYQQARTGQGYAGIHAWIPSKPPTPQYREYLLVKLLDTLIKDESYSIRFFVSPAENSTHLSDDIGAYVCKEIPQRSDVYKVFPSVRNQEGRILSDTTNWQLISGTYIAKGGERYLIIGNFLRDEQMNRQQVNTGSGSPTVYYYIDDISILPCPKLPQKFTLGPDTALCPGESILLYPDLQRVNYLWGDGSDKPFYQTKDTGSVTLTIQFEACEYADTIRIGKGPELPFNPGKDTLLCEGEGLWLGDSVAGASYLWSNNATTPFIWADKPGNWRVAAFKDGFCPAYRDISLSYAPILSPFDSNTLDTLVCKGDSLVLTPPDKPFYAYLWNDGSTLSRRKVVEGGFYSVRVSTLCYDFDWTYNINTTDCDCRLAVPNLLSPNGDGINDMLVPELPLNSKGYDLTIYDRWGKIWLTLSETGTRGNTRLQPGVYYWQARTQCQIGAEYRFGTQGGTILVL